MGGFGGGPGWGHHGRGPMTPEQMSQRIDRGVDRMLGDVGATDEQKRKVADIAKAAATELAPLRDKHRAARRQAMELMAAPTIDRPALERLRAEQLQMADAASRRITQAMADAAEVLTPEQRAKLKERMDRRMRRD